MKISGMGFAWRHRTVEPIRPYVLGTTELPGTDRAIFASSFPTDKLFGSLDRHLAADDAVTTDFSEAERAAPFADNANRVYGLDVDLAP